jgi:putative GTP pyrophosphokinase
MPWPTPEYSKSQVRKAGQTLINDNSSFEEFYDAFLVVENWRSCHGYPINTFQATLRSKLKAIDPDALVSQRLKRMPSILNKLTRFLNMSLDRMQDFGGLRAVVSSNRKLRELEQNYRNSRFKHELVSCRDYVTSPKESGYRSIHLVYKYINPFASAYNGLFIELQLRTKLQHAWATSVETMGTFLGQALKSSEGEELWLDYFSLCSAAFSHVEDSPVHQDYNNRAKLEIFTDLVERTKHLQVKDKLNGFSVAAQNIAYKNRRGAYHLIVLKFEERKVSIQSFGKSNLELASEKYAEVELAISNGAPMHAVLVSAGSLENLRRAYPSYFLDTKEFLKYLQAVERARNRLLTKPSSGRAKGARR